MFVDTATSQMDATNEIEGSNEGPQGKAGCLGRGHEVHDVDLTLLLARLPCDVTIEDAVVVPVSGGPDSFAGLAVLVE